MRTRIFAVCFISIAAMNCGGGESVQSVSAPGTIDINSDSGVSGSGGSDTGAAGSSIGGSAGSAGTTNTGGNGGTGTVDAGPPHVEILYTTTPADLNHQLLGIVVDDTKLYWSNGPDLYRAPKDGSGQPELFYNGTGMYLPLYIIGDHLFAADGEANTNSGTAWFEATGKTFGIKTDQQFVADTFGPGALHTYFSIDGVYQYYVRSNPQILYKINTLNNVSEKLYTFPKVSNIRYQCNVQIDADYIYACNLRFARNNLQSYTTIPGCDYGPVIKGNTLMCPDDFLASKVNIIDKTTLLIKRTINLPVICTGTLGVYNIQFDENYVYYMSQDGELKKVSIATGTETTLATKQSPDGNGNDSLCDIVAQPHYMQGLTSDDKYLYWTIPPNFTISRIAK